MRFSQPAARAMVGACAAMALCTTRAPAQVTYSIDYGGPTISLPDSIRFTPITESDLLAAPGFAPVLGPFRVRPMTVVAGGGAGGLGLALYWPCVGHAPGFPCGVEVDAVSYGVDGPALPGMPPASWWFSVDEFAVGMPVGAPPPDVFSEGASPGSALEAGADVFTELIPLPAGPIPPMAIVGPNHLGLDGNGFRGLTRLAGRGLATIEWNPPGAPPDLGDNVDALDVDFPPVVVPVTYFSLDSAFVDPLTGVPNSASAIRHGFVGGDVLMSPPGGPPALYAPAVVLGLDRMGPPDGDDLDALVLFENGMAGYQPSTAPYDWLTGPKDMLLFSVRRGSRVIGAPDSFFGAPIQEGDILTPPVVGGVSPFPGIFISAEALGLATVRGMPVPFGDDLDGLDVKLALLFDCNANGQEDVVDIFTGIDPDCNATGIPDSCDIAMGTSWDFNVNGVPDECEFAPHTTYCVAKVNSQGCTPMIGAFGTPSATNVNPFWISAVDVISNKVGIYYYGLVPVAVPWQGGTKCVGGQVKRTPIQNSGGVNPPNNCTGVFGYEFNARIQSGIDPWLVPGATIYGQYWYRDPTSSFTVGLSDGIQLTIGP